LAARTAHFFFFAPSSPLIMDLKTVLPPPIQLLDRETLLRLDDGSLVQHCRRVYALEMQRLKWRHRNGAAGPAITVGRSALLDAVGSAVWDRVQRESGKESDALTRELRRAAWIALGEYGRLDLAPHSPVDVLLLLKSSASGELGIVLARPIKLIQSIGCEL